MVEPDKWKRIMGNYDPIRIYYQLKRKTRILRCTRCGYENTKKVGIKVHMSRVRSEIRGSYDAECPYCPSTFANLGGLNRHLQ